MLFSSMTFLWIFLPFVIIINYILGIIPLKNNIRAKNIFLLFASLIFYAWGSIYYLLIMLFCIILNFFGGILLEKFENKKKTTIVVVVFLNLLVLGYFKYFNLVISSIEAVLRMQKGGLGIKEVVLPIGISFFIFQAMSYVLDVYWGKVKTQKNIFTFALYVSLFPQLIAGPIVQYKDVQQQLILRQECQEKFVYGIKRFCYGLGKKVLLANTLGAAVDAIWETEVASLGFDVAILGAIAYTLQIYYDFSGYSDMAIGLGKMLGFDFKENFNYPYISLSIKEFWRRWHISLSSWFRDYVYIPLGGSRVSTGLIYRNLFLVFLLTGIWHGANYTFLAWGLYYAFFIIVERAFLGKILDKNPVKIVNYFYTILVVIVGWILFRAPSINEALVFFGGLFRKPGASTMLDFLSMKLLLALVFGMLFSGPVQRLSSKVYARVKENIVVMYLDLAVQILLFVFSVLSLVSNTYNPFIYFQF